MSCATFPSELLLSPDTGAEEEPDSKEEQRISRAIWKFPQEPGSHLRGPATCRVMEKQFGRPRRLGSASVTREGSQVPETSA